MKSRLRSCDNYLPVEELGVGHPVGHRIPDKLKVAVDPYFLQCNDIVVRRGQCFGNGGHAFRPELGDILQSPAGSGQRTALS